MNEVKRARYIPDDGYYDNGMIGSSNLKLYLDSPVKYWHYAKDSIGPSKALRIGSAVDAMLLEDDNEQWEHIVVKGPKDRRTKMWKEWIGTVQEWQIPLTADEYDEAIALRNCVMANDAARALISGDGVEHQVAAAYDDAATGLPCRLKADAWKPGEYVLDLKTFDSRRASESGIVRQIIEYKYDVQAAHYKIGLDAVVGFDHKWILLMVPKIKNPSPDAVFIVELNDAWLDRGFALRRKALDGIAAREVNRFSRAACQLELPSWANISTEEQGE